MRTPFVAAVAAILAIVASTSSPSPASAGQHTPVPAAAFAATAPTTATPSDAASPNPESSVVTAVTLSSARFGQPNWPAIQAVQGAALSYQWYVNGVAPADASTSFSFSPSQSMIGATLSVAVTGTLEGYQTNTLISTPVVIEPGILQYSTPTIAGTVGVGQTIEVDPGTGWTAGTEFAYQWFDNGIAIPGATDVSTALTAAELGHTIAVQVTGSHVGYADTTKASSATVQRGVLTTTAPTIVGVAQIGARLTVAPGAWTPGTTFAYQWLNCGSNYVYTPSRCVPIPGAVGSTLLLPAADESDTIAVTVTGSLAGYLSVSTTSALTGYVVPAPHVFTRIAGSDRYATDVAASKRMFPNGASTVFLVSGVNFPDALSAAPAAAAIRADLLLTAPGSLPASIASELRRVHPSAVYLIGGSAAVSQAVAAQVKSATGVSAQRLYGADRYATSAAIAARFFPNATAAFTATGSQFQDALSAAGAAGSMRAPLLLVNGAASAPSAGVAAQLKRLHPAKVYIVGPTSEVSTKMQTSLTNSGPVTRLSGTDYYATAVAVSRATHVYSSSAVVASAASFPDALVGAVVAGLDDAPLYLSPSGCLPAAAVEDMDRIGASNIVVMGGTSVLSADVAGRLECN